MGYRGKLSERQQARQPRRAGLPLAEIASRLGVQEQRVAVGPRRAVRAAFGPGSRPPPRSQRPAAAAAGRDRPVGRGGSGADRAVVGARVPGLGGRAVRGEGSKTDGCVRFANSDPRMIFFYCCWLRRFFAIDESRLRIHLYLHEGLDLPAAIAHWSAVTAIPPSQFGKPYRAVPDPSIRHAKHVHGCATVSYSCSPTHRTIMGLVGALLSGAAIPG